MVEEDSDRQLSSDEDESEDDEEAEWYYRVCEAANAVATAQSPSPEPTQDHPTAQTQPSTSTYRNATIIDASSHLINDTTRIVWEDVPTSPRRPTAVNTAQPDDEQRPHPRMLPSRASDVALALANQRPRSPSLEIIATSLERHVRSRGYLERKRRERQRQYIQRALQDEGFVCTGFRVP